MYPPLFLECYTYILRSQENFSALVIALRTLPRSLLLEASMHAVTVTMISSSLA